MKFVECMGYKVYDDTLDNIHNPSESIVINTISPNSYGIATKDHVFKKALKSSDYLVLDGVYFALASILRDGKSIKKNQGPDVFYHFMKKMQNESGKGSGLGSSSTYIVGLLNALYAYNNTYICKESLAHQACEIEIQRCGEPIGKQDQYAAAYGGLNLIRFFPDESVVVDPIIFRPSLLKELESSIIVFYTGRTRSASKILAKQSEGLRKKDRKKLMRKMVQLAFDMKKELESGNLENFGEILHENWRLKVQMSSGITDYQIDEWYSKGLANGAKGGKLLGAGNGGFIMFFAPEENHKKIVYALSELQQVKFDFESDGSRIVFYQPYKTISK